MTTAPRIPVQFVLEKDGAPDLNKTPGHVLINGDRTVEDAIKVLRDELRVPQRSWQTADVQPVSVWDMTKKRLLGAAYLDSKLNSIMCDDYAIMVAPKPVTVPVAAVNLPPAKALQPGVTSEDTRAARAPSPSLSAHGEALAYRSTDSGLDVQTPSFEAQATKATPRKRVASGIARSKFCLGTHHLKNGSRQTKKAKSSHFKATKECDVNEVAKKKQVKSYRSRTVEKSELEELYCSWFPGEEPLSCDDITCRGPIVAEGHMQVEKDDYRRVYYSVNNETPFAIAQKFDEDLKRLLFNNFDLYPGLKENSKLKPATAILLPLVPEMKTLRQLFPGEAPLNHKDKPRLKTHRGKILEQPEMRRRIYYTEDDETFTQIAKRLNEDLSRLLFNNMRSIAGLHATAPLPQNTPVLLTYSQSSTARLPETTLPPVAPARNIFLERRRPAESA